MTAAPTSAQRPSPLTALAAGERLVTEAVAAGAGAARIDADQLTSVRRRRARLALLTAVVLLVLLALVAVWSAGVGQFPVSPGNVIASIRRHLTGVAAANPAERFMDAALWTIRFPRVTLGIVVGAALGLAGSLTQSLFANPLAEPGVVGITAGASVGAAASMVFGGAAAAASISTPVAAFVAGLFTTALVWGVAKGTGADRVVALLLVGVAVNALAGALSSFLFFLAPTTTRDAIVFWQMGSLNAATWRGVAIVAPALLLGLLGALLLAPRLDLLALGDRTAVHLGTNVRAVRLATIVCVAFLTGVAVAFVGVIAFVGLIVPHILRLIVGPRQRVLAPLAALGGAVLVCLADLAARTLIPYADLPIGMITSVIGAPLFLLLLRRTMRSRGIGAGV